MVVCKMDGQWEVAARIQPGWIQPGLCDNLEGQDGAGTRVAQGAGMYLPLWLSRIVAWQTPTTV